MGSIVINTQEITVAASATPQSLSDLTGVTSSTKVQITTRDANATAHVFIGDKDNQDYPIRDTETFVLSNFMSARGEEPYDLTKIFLRVVVNGEGVHILTSQRG